MMALSIPPDNDVPGAVTIERGHIYFFYRPRVDEEDANSVSDVQRLFIVLRPTEGLSKNVHRLIDVSAKTLPDPAGNLVVEERTSDADHQKERWAFVEHVAPSMEEVLTPIRRRQYDTARHGTRTLDDARPCGAGVYAMVVENEQTHLCYVLRLPATLGEVQAQLNIHEKASLVLTVKNPAYPKTAPGKDPAATVQYPEELLQLFAGNEFIRAQPTSLLDHANAEIMLVPGAEGKLDDAERGTGVETLEEGQFKGIRQLNDRPKIFEEMTPEKPSVKPKKSENQMATAILAGAGIAAAALIARAAYRASVLSNPSSTSKLGANSSKYHKGGFQQTMNRKEAALVLGIRESANREKLKEAHRRIMLANHPDRGGSPYLASKINEAKELFEKGLR
ncbi:hypothetical protein HK101_008498 [Irineochytrium annulatum]|nr:hypothetical protein HK101_008498 [Irineochytrium annulatum]